MLYWFLGNRLVRRQDFPSLHEKFLTFLDDLHNLYNTLVWMKIPNLFSKKVKKYFIEVHWMNCNSSVYHTKSFIIKVLLASTIFILAISINFLCIQPVLLFCFKFFAILHLYIFEHNFSPWNILLPPTFCLIGFLILL